MSEPKPEYVTEAMELLGAGYEHPAIEIETPRTVIERRNGRMQEVERAAFVKISTAFKPEMKDIDEIALKVWLYIALSVNRFTGKANPGLRTIAEGCGLAVNTVRAAISRLENSYSLLTVNRTDRKYNIYEPVEFVSARRESVSPDDTDSKTVSDRAQTVSDLSKTVSPRMILNQINQNKPDRYIDPVIAHMESIGMFPNSNTRVLLKCWREKHTDEWIIKALDKSRGKSQNYADKILIGWEADGYPKTREQQVDERRNSPKANNGVRTSYGQSALQKLAQIAASDTTTAGMD